MLKATTFAALFAVVSQAKTDSIHNRKLTYSSIAGYRPETLVTDYNAIDQDQILMETALMNATEDAFEIARRVYYLGANVGSFALLKLQTNELPGMTLGESVTGTSVDGVSVTGTLDEVPPTSSTTGKIEIKVLYDVSQTQAAHVGCRVGGNPDPVTDGCFQATGEVTIGTLGTWTYTYVVEEDNQNLVTLQSFSTNAPLSMKPAGSNEWFVQFQKFVDYFGTPYYANDWVTAALGGFTTSFDCGNFDFRNETYIARGRAVAIATVNFGIAMNVISELENGVDSCQTCVTNDCFDDAINSIDKAVALYTGSSEGTGFSNGAGYLLYRNADLRCSQFKTCGENADLDEGVSYVNRQIFEQVLSMRRNLIEGDCNSTFSIKDRITQLLYVPIIQSTLKYAHMMCYDKQTDNVTTLEGATYAAAVLPMVAACDEDAASIIKRNMEPGQNDTDYLAVVLAFESQYACLGITCEDVGGVWNGSEYRDGGEPCINFQRPGLDSGGFEPLPDEVKKPIFGVLAAFFYLFGVVLNN